MSTALPDLLAGAGFIVLMAGIVTIAGVGWGLVIGGAVLLSTGIVIAWRRHSA